MSKIVYVDLDIRSVREEALACTTFSDVGLGLALRLASESHRSDPAKGCLVVAPGLLSGTVAPSSCRVNLVGFGPREKSLQVANTSGPLPQKLGSLDIAALVVSGSYQVDRLVTLHLGPQGSTVDDASTLRNRSVSTTIGQLRGQWGDETAMMGVGPAGEHLLPLASIFSTYPSGGTPVYHVGRNQMGHVFGQLGLKAIAVTVPGHFTSPVLDGVHFKEDSRRLGRLIVEHPVCGGAMPAYGSITLIKMMKHGHDFAAMMPKGERPAAASRAQTGLNRHCGPGCVIGCLNRHASTAEEAYSSPAESEVRAACGELFPSMDEHSLIALARELNQSCFEQGIDSLEFLASAALLLRAEGHQVTTTAIWQLFTELGQLTLRGRMVGSRTTGIAPFFPDRPDIAAQVTRPSTESAPRFRVSMPYKAAGCEAVDDMEYLYAYMMAAENFGICLFTAFAILESPSGQETVAELVKAKTGLSVSAVDLIAAGRSVLEQMRRVEGQISGQGQTPRIPEFVKVLYRYFHRQEASAN